VETIELMFSGPFAWLPGAPVASLAEVDEEAGLVYWTMGAPLNDTTIINRCRKETSFEYRSKNGKLPG
jgi:hypothetical protein